MDEEETVGLSKLLVISNLYDGYNLSAFDNSSEDRREAEACLPCAEGNRKEHTPPGKIYLVDAGKMSYEQRKLENLINGNFQLLLMHLLVVFEGRYM